tara:strand:- start:1700 stop:2464 length:765 start_codon:yes stop_codon:yes gene_type:complete
MVTAWVLKTFQVDESGLTGAHVFIEARQPGLFAFLLNLLGLDPTATLKVTKGSISFKTSKLSGMTQTSTSLTQIGSFQGGYKKPIELLVLAFILFTGAIAIDLTAEMEGILILIGLTISLILIVCYALFKHLFIGFETSGGAYYGMTFKRGILNNVSVDINQIEYTIAYINTLIGSASLGSSTFSESLNVTKVANQTIIKSVPVAASMAAMPAPASPRQFQQQYPPAQAVLPLPLQYPSPPTPPKQYSHHPPPM